MTYRINAPAKINLWLKIRGKRDDGFHELETLFCELDLVDQLSWTPGPHPLRLDVQGADIGKPEENLVMKAARLFRETSGLPVGGVLTLVKQIPMGGGLGGGSSNAAAALRLFNLHHDEAVADATLAEMALQLGSDVPFFLRGGLQIGKGRGELLTPVTLPPDCPRHGFVIMPGMHMSTPAVFKAYAGMAKPRSGNKPPVIGENDLCAAACRVDPLFAKIYADLTERCTTGVFFMTGSGSTMVWLMDDPDDAEAARLLAPHTFQAVSLKDF